MSQPIERRDSVFGNGRPPKGGAGGGWFWGGEFIQASEGCLISVPCVYSPAFSQEASFSPYHQHIQAAPSGAHKGQIWIHHSHSGGGILAQETPSQTVSQVLEVAFPTNMTPLHLNVGASKGLQIPGWGVHWGTIHLLGSHMYSCALGPFGGEVGLSILHPNSS